MGIKDEFKALLDEFESKIHGLFDKVKDSPEVTTAVDDAKTEVSGLVDTAKTDAEAIAKQAEGDAAKSASDAGAVVNEAAGTVQAAPQAVTPPADPAPGQAG